MKAGLIVHVFEKTQKIRHCMYFFNFYNIGFLTLFHLKHHTWAIENERKYLQKKTEFEVLQAQYDNRQETQFTAVFWSHVGDSSFKESESALINSLQVNMRSRRQGK